MMMVLLFVLLVANAVISAANAYGAGRTWKVTHGFEKLVNWAAVVMSVCGFTSVASIVIGALAVMSHLVNAHAFAALVGLVYVLIIGPVLVGGLILTVQSWIEAYKRRDISSMGVAAWNTFAQAHNTYDAFSGGISGMGDAVSKFFDDDDEDASSKLVVLALALVAGALGGALTWKFFQIGRRHAVEVTARPVYA